MRVSRPVGSGQLLPLFMDVDSECGFRSGLY
jgi:hypothetical protein